MRQNVLFTAPMTLKALWFVLGSPFLRRHVPQEGAVGGMPPVSPFSRLPPCPGEATRRPEQAAPRLVLMKDRPLQRPRPSKG